MSDTPAPPVPPTPSAPGSGTGLQGTQLTPSLARAPAGVPPAPAGADGPALEAHAPALPIPAHELARWRTWVADLVSDGHHAHQAHLHELATLAERVRKRLTLDTAGIHDLSRTLGDLHALHARWQHERADPPAALAALRDGLHRVAYAELGSLAPRLSHVTQMHFDALGRTGALVMPDAHCLIERTRLARIAGDLESVLGLLAQLAGDGHDREEASEPTTITLRAGYRPPQLLFEFHCPQITDRPWAQRWLALGEAGLFRTGRTWQAGDDAPWLPQVVLGLVPRRHTDFWAHYRPAQGLWLGYAIDLGAETPAAPSAEPNAEPNAEPSAEPLSAATHAALLHRTRGLRTALAQARLSADDRWDALCTHSAALRATVEPPDAAHPAPHLREWLRVLDEAIRAFATVTAAHRDRAWLPTLTQAATHLEHALLLSGPAQPLALDAGARTCQVELAGHTQRLAAWIAEHSPRETPQRPGPGAIEIDPAAVGRAEDAAGALPRARPGAEARPHAPVGDDLSHTPGVTPGELDLETAPTLDLDELLSGPDAPNRAEPEGADAFGAESFAPDPFAPDPFAPDLSVDPFDAVLPAPEPAPEPAPAPAADRGTPDPSPPPPPAPAPAPAAPSPGAPAATEAEARAVPPRATKRSQAAPQPQPTRQPIQREVAIRYYARMNPRHHFPLTVVLTPERVELVVSERVTVSYGDRPLALEANDPWVIIRPHFPGCLVSPEQATLRVDADRDLLTARFVITPLSLGEWPEAYVDLIHNDARMLRVPTPTRVVALTRARALAAAGILTAVATPILETFNLTWGAQFSEDFPLIRQALDLLGPTGLALAATALLLLGGGVAYLLARPVVRQEQPLLDPAAQHALNTP